jgi:hypothetical protein
MNRAVTFPSSPGSWAGSTDRRYHRQIEGVGTERATNGRRSTICEPIAEKYSAP